MKPRDFLLIPATTLAVIIANVALSFAMVWVYSAFFNPGRTQAYYEAFAARAVPISSVITVIPLMLLAGYWLAGGRDRRGALLAAGAIVLLYMALDIAILVGAGVSASDWAWAGFAQVVKLLAALAGAALRTRR